jgi:glycerol-3-phosphate acyltransferase PlsY
LNSIAVVGSSLVVVLAYLLGSLSFAVIVSRVMGLHDPRTYGSKNPGATNVLRSGSKRAALVTLLLDAMKGWLPVVLVRWFGKPYGLEEGTVALVMLAAFAGHLYPIFFKFVGGKGVATAFGVWLGAQPLLMLAAGLTWLLTAWLFRYSSLASLVVALVVPLLYVFAPLWTVQPALALSLVAMSVLLIGRHAENIRRLRQGTESRLGKPKPMP